MVPVPARASVLPRVGPNSFLPSLPKRLPALPPARPNQTCTVRFPTRRPDPPRAPDRCAATSAQVTRPLGRPATLLAISKSEGEASDGIINTGAATPCAPPDPLPPRFASSSIAHSSIAHSSMLTSSSLQSAIIPARSFVGNLLRAFHGFMGARVVGAASSGLFWWV